MKTLFKLILILGMTFWMIQLSQPLWQAWMSILTKLLNS